MLYFLYVVVLVDSLIVLLLCTFSKNVLLFFVVLIEILCSVFLRSRRTFYVLIILRSLSTSV